MTAQTAPEANKDEFQPRGDQHDREAYTRRSPHHRVNCCGRIFKSVDGSIEGCWLVDVNEYHDKGKLKQASILASSRRKASALRKPPDSYVARRPLLAYAAIRRPRGDALQNATMMRQDLEALDDVDANYGLVRSQHPARHRAKRCGAMGLLQFVKCGRALLQPDEGFLGSKDRPLPTVAANVLPRQRSALAIGAERGDFATRTL
jgi:hypothetical protein